MVCIRNDTETAYHIYITARLAESERTLCAGRRRSGDQHTMFSHRKHPCTLLDGAGGIAASGKAVGDELPDGYQNNRADERPEERDTKHNDIPDAGDNDDVRHQPDAYQRCDDGTHKA